MPNIKDIPELIDPGFIGGESVTPFGGGAGHTTSGEAVLNGIQIGDDLYEINGYIVNGKGEILGTK